MATKTTLNAMLRNEWVNTLVEKISTEELDVLRTGSNEISIPVLDSEKNEKWIVITVKVPTGSRDGDEYDGYEKAEDYEIRMKEKKEKAEKRKAEKAKKIERDKKNRKNKTK